MALFRKRRRRRPTVSAAGAADRPHPFTAVPVVTEGVESREDDQGRIQLRLKLPERSGLKEFLARKLGFRRTVRVNLDETGSRFWKLIDGRRSLAEIEKEIRKQLDVSGKESREATVLFVKSLMTRGLIHLEMPVRNA